jgi:tetratricopeptide (TPR) repeat protein
MMNKINLAIELIELLITNHDDGDSLVRESTLKERCLEKYTSSPNTNEITESVEHINSCVGRKVISEGWIPVGGIFSVINESSYLTEYSISKLESIKEILNNGNNRITNESQVSEIEEILKFQNKWSLMPMDDKINIARETDRVNNIGAKYYNDDNFDEAIKHFKMALSIMPSNNDAIENLISCYKYLGQLDKVALYSKLLSQLNQN